MADTTDRPAVAPAPLPAAEAASPEYRPVSGWAVASAVVAGVYVVVIVAGGGLALYSWSPYLLPLWTLLLPLAGLGLALFAQLHVRRAEGTRAGHGLARAAWWTCLVLGAIYLSFYASTFLAVRRQADAFVQKWFDLLKAGHVNEAFLMTEQPAKRVGVSPQDEQLLNIRFNVGQPGTRGALSTFRASELAQLIQQGGAEGRIEGKGVQNWAFEEGNYKVTRLYQITTPEGEMEATITTIGAEDKHRVYEGRQWHLFWDSASITRVKLTPFGERVAALRGQALLFLDQWSKNVLMATPASLESAYLDTQSAAERAAKGAAFREGKVDLKNFVHAQQFRAENKLIEGVVLEALQNLFKPGGAEQPRFLDLKISPIGSRPWKQAEGKITFTVDANFVLGADRKTIYRGDLGLVVESEPDALDAGKSAHWRVVRVEPILAMDPFSTPNKKLLD